MAADVTTSPAFKVVGLLRQRFVAPLLGGPARFKSYDVAGNGQRFLINTSPELEVNRGSITVVVNWPSLLEK